MTRATFRANASAAWRIIPRWIFLVFFLRLLAHGQDTQFLPEIDAHLALNSNFRVYLQVKDDREGGDQEQFAFGPSIQVFLKPLIRLKRVTLFDLDGAKSRVVVLERTFAIRSYHFIPYVAVEPFYESRYEKWSSTDLYAGCSFPIGKQVKLNAYYEHENDTGKAPNRQNTFVGVALDLFFGP